MTSPSSRNQALRLRECPLMRVAPTASTAGPSFPPRVGHQTAGRARARPARPRPPCRCSRCRARAQARCGPAFCCAQTRGCRPTRGRGPPGGRSVASSSLRRRGIGVAGFSRQKEQGALGGNGSGRARARRRISRPGRNRLTAPVRRVSGVAAATGVVATSRRCCCSRVRRGGSWARATCALPRMAPMGVVAVARVRESGPSRLRLCRSVCRSRSICRSRSSICRSRNRSSRRLLSSLSQSRSRSRSHSCSRRFSRTYSSSHRLSRSICRSRSRSGGLRT
mmetsp:Transcript_41919/g.103397  ORF Transcript_41919/g.103397 Transcript_41919/m.103397 type:complete len:280 (-) Transcript_41919:45-884(-)